LCFSATASFSAGIVLTVVGIASIKKAQNPSHYFFASIPILFGLQQISEGFLWLSLPNPNESEMQKGLTYAFLFFAQVLWPAWVPLSVMMLVPKVERKITQKILVGLGIFAGLAFGISLFNYPVDAKISGNHVLYSQMYPKSLRIYGVVLYVIVTVIPLYFSSVKKMWLLGTGILSAYIVSAIFYSQYLLSVWCFFAAIISITVFVIIRNRTKMPGA
jgi:hypothetical protein